MGYQRNWRAFVAALALLASTLPALAIGEIGKDEIYFMQDGVMTPEEIMEEGEYIQSLCDKNAYQALYFDCSCIKDALVAKRTELGPEARQQNILNELTKSDAAVCANSETIRQTKLESCTQDVEDGSIQFFVIDRNPTKDQQLEYCQCAADRFVEKFAAAPKLSTQYIRNINVDTSKSCLKPEDR